MRKIKGNDTVFSKLIKDKDEVIYNILALIREDEKAFIVTDDDFYIIAQNNEKTPAWIWLKEKPDQKKEEIAQVISYMLNRNNNLKVTAKEEYIKEILDMVSSKSKIKHEVNMPMNVYCCEKVNQPALQGRIIRPSKKYRDIMARLIMEMECDAENIIISKEQAYRFADLNADSKIFFLWEDKKAVSMAKISHKAGRYARINTVVTDRRERNHGYGGMLVSEISKRLLSEGIIPMLYADARNPVSNAMYRKIGYQEQGLVTEFIFG